ncbi:protein kinase domain-containing protein [Georgenia sp. Z1344]|uniref:serine/threonine-protein kinase n=1 Tax=Georgenia sp. Z1344 TaxID=3416706 RepID=UPI003CF97E8C
MSGRPLGSRYTLDREIGRGAVGSVWRGHRNDDGQVVAIKRLRSEVAEDLEIVRRFIQERALLTNVVHPNVVQVIDLVVEGSTLAIVMELVEGGDLRQEVDRRGTLAPGDAAAYGAGVARGLAAIHAGGVVHRDVKPANILLDRTDDGAVPKVTDFGVARVTHGEITEATSATMVVGTPLYMAPEIVLERLPTPASDIYSFGILVYRMLTGVTPFTGDGGTYGVMRRQTELLPGRPDGLPDELWDVVQRCLDKEPEARPEAAALADELDALATVLADLPARPRLVHPPVGTPARRPALADGPTALGVTADGSSEGGRPSGSSPAAGSRPADDSSAGSRAAGSSSSSSVGTASAGSSSSGTAGEHAPDDAEPTVRRDRTGLVPAVGGPVVSAGAPGRGAPLRVHGEVVDDGYDARRRRGRTLPLVLVSAVAVLALVVAGVLWFTRDTEPEVTVMPNLWGMTLEEAEEEMGGVDVVAVDGLADSHEIGTVMGQSPRTDEPVDGEVEVTIARESERRDLADLEPLTGDDLSEPVQEAVDLGEEAFLRGYTSEPSVPEGAWGWDLDSGFRVFRAEIGRMPATFDDEAHQTTYDSYTVAVEVTGDGEILWSGSVTLDEPRALTLDVEGVDEIVVRWSLTSGGDNATAGFAIGDGRVLAAPGELPERYQDG